MQQLTAADTSFLSMETASQFGHVGSLYIFDDGAGYEQTRNQIEQRLHLLPPYRRQLVEVPFGLDQPYWIESPNFDLDFHVRHLAVPPPGDRLKLSDMVARLAARPLDRSRPLWEWYVIEGVESGGVAHYVKTHHAAVDGASGTELMTILLDDSPNPPPVEPPVTPWRPDEVPNEAALWGRTMLNLATQPARLAQAQFKLWREMADRTRESAAANGGQSWGAWMRPGDAAPQGDRLVAGPAAQAPRTPFNATITPHRRWTYLSLPLDEVKRVKNHFKVTLNDVVLEMCASALRKWLADRDALPSDPLTAMCPISIRTGNETEKYSNRVSGMITSLATNVADPVERLMIIHEATKSAKEQFGAMPAEALQDFSQFSPPAVAAQASRMLAQSRISDVINPPFNVTISNVPGPRHPLYLAGAQLRQMYPVSIVTDGLGLNITCCSYMDSLDFGLISCRELIPDLWQLNDSLRDALDELSRAAS